MNKILIASLCLMFFVTGFLANDTAEAYDRVNGIVAQKRAEAERQKMMMMQNIQHRQANPEAYMNRTNQATTREASVSYDASSNGHFVIPVTINGRSVSFMADTGATDIFLTQNDAKRLGLNISNLNYNIIYNTANGQVRAAETVVNKLSVGPIQIANIPVSISQNSDGVSLLGMRFFQELSSYGVKDGKLTLVK